MKIYLTRRLYAASRAVAVLLLIVMVFALSGCFPLSYKGWDGGYAGLKQRVSVAASAGANIHVLMVHGMGDHCPGEWAPLMDGFARELSLASNNIILTNLLPSSLEGVTNELRTFHFSAGRTNFIFYELTWTPTTLPYKTHAFAKDRAVGDGRLWLDKQVKHDVLDEGFGDAALYLNPRFRPYMQEPIRQALENVATNAHDGDQIILITHSLGSVMTFDTVTEHVKSNSPYADSMKKFAGMTTDIIMFANQIPLINLGLSGNIAGKPSVRDRDNSARQFFRISQQAKLARYEKRPEWDSLTPEAKAEFLKMDVVAATDPNDLLSWPVTTNDITPWPELAGVVTNRAGHLVSAETNISLANIYMHNAWGILWSAEYPESAHDNYQKNAWLIRKILNGFAPKRPAFTNEVAETFCCDCQTNK